MKENEENDWNHKRMNEINQRKKMKDLETLTQQKLSTRCIRTLKTCQQKLKTDSKL